MNYSVNFSFSRKEIYNSFLIAILTLLLLISFFYLKTFAILIFLPFIIISLIKGKYNLEIPILLVLLLSTNVFEFGSVEQLPFIQLGAGFRFNFLDIIVFIYVLFLGNRIIHTPSTPSSWLIKFMILISTIYLVVGVILTGHPREAGFNYYRTLFYISFYFIFYFYFKEPANIKKILLILSVWVFIGTIFHIAEYFLNYRLTLPGVIPLSSFYSETGEKILTAGQERIYLWSRVTSFVFIMLSFSIAIYVQKKGLFYILIFLLAIFGFLIASSRIWFLGVLLIILTIFIFNSYIAKIRIFIPILVFLILISIFQNFSLQYTGLDFISSLLRRAESAVTLGRTYGELDTFGIRVLMFNFLLQKFLDSPLFGFGFGDQIASKYYSVDLGIINRLVFFGLLGTLPLIYFIFSYSIKLFRIIQSKIDSNKRVILLSTLAILIGHFPMYLWQIDFWGNNYIFVIVMILAMSDRIINGLRLEE